jgi:hypothetical protein
MSETEVLLLAADILQRKVNFLSEEALGRTIDEPLLAALKGCGVVVHTIECLRALAVDLKDEVK